MPTERIKCPACGFGALLFTTAECAKLTVDSAKQIQVCNRLRDQPKRNTGKVGPLDCRDFLDAFQKPAKDCNPSSATLDDERESETIEVEQAVAEEASNATPGRVGRSRGAEAAEIEAGSPEAKSARRRPRKRASRRSSHSDVANGDSMVS